MNDELFRQNLDAEAKWHEWCSNNEYATYRPLRDDLHRQVMTWLDEKQRIYNIMRKMGVYILVNTLIVIVMFIYTLTQ